MSRSLARADESDGETLSQSSGSSDSDTQSSDSEDDDKRSKRSSAGSDHSKRSRVGEIGKLVDNWSTVVDTTNADTLVGSLMRSRTKTARYDPFVESSRPQLEQKKLQTSSQMKQPNNNVRKRQHPGNVGAVKEVSKAKTEKKAAAKDKSRNEAGRLSREKRQRSGKDSVEKAKSKSSTERKKAAVATKKVSNSSRSAPKGDTKVVVAKGTSDTKVLAAKRKSGPAKESVSERVKSSTEGNKAVVATKEVSKTSTSAPKGARKVAVAKGKSETEVLAAQAKGGPDKGSVSKGQISVTKKRKLAKKKIVNEKKKEAKGTTNQSDDEEIICDPDSFEVDMEFDKSDIITTVTWSGLSWDGAKRFASFLNDQDKAFNLEYDAEGALKLQVLCVLRYIPDPTTHVIAYAGVPKDEAKVLAQEGSAFDLVLSDGFERFRCALDQRFNILVYSGFLCDLCIIEIRTLVKLGGLGRASQKDELPDLKFDNVVGMIAGLTVVEQAQKVIALSERTTGVRWTGNIETREKNYGSDKTFGCAVPLLPSRGSYVAFSSDDCTASALTMPPPYANLNTAALRLDLMQEEILTSVNLATNARICASKTATFVDQIWLNPPPGDVEQPRTAQDQFPTTKSIAQSIGDATLKLAEMATKLPTALKSTRIGPIYGIISKKSAISYYGKQTLKNAWPVKFQFELRDSTKTISVTVWNRACRSYFSQIVPGRYLLLENARFKLRRRSQGSPMDIAINAEDGNLAERVRLSALSPNEVPDRLKQFLKGVNIDDGETLLDPTTLQNDAVKSMCAPGAHLKRYTVAGVLTYVGRREIQAVTYQGRMFEFRWIRVRFSSSSLSTNTSSSSAPSPSAQLGHLVHELCIQLYVNGNVSDYMNMAIGDRIALTGMALQAQLGVGSLGQISVLARTTQYTCIYLNENFLRTLTALYTSCFAQSKEDDVGEVIVTPRQAPSNPSSRRGRREHLSSMTWENKVVDDFKHLLENNASREAYLHSHYSMFSGLYEGQGGEHLRCIPVSMQQGRDIAALAARFPPCDTISIANLLETRKSMRLAETRHYLILARIQVVSLVLNEKTGMYELRLQLKSADDAVILQARCIRDPIIGPVVDPKVLATLEGAKQYYMLRMRGIGRSKNKNIRTAQGPEKDSEQCFLVSVHKYAFDKAETLVRASFNASTAEDEPDA